MFLLSRESWDDKLSFHAGMFLLSTMLVPDYLPAFFWWCLSFRMLQRVYEWLLQTLGLFPFFLSWPLHLNLLQLVRKWQMCGCLPVEFILLTTHTCLYYNLKHLYFILRFHHFQHLHITYTTNWQASVWKAPDLLMFWRKYSKGVQTHFTGDLTCFTCDQICLTCDLTCLHVIWHALHVIWHVYRWSDMILQVIRDVLHVIRHVIEVIWHVWQVIRYVWQVFRYVLMWSDMF